MLAAALAGGLALVGGAPYDLVGIVVVFLVVVVALSLDAFGGIVVGLVGAAALVATRRLGDDWTSAVFEQALALSAALVVLGWVTGMLGSRLRTTPSGATGAPTAVAAAPAPGSLGLLPAELTMARLDEEVVRARRHRRPLSVVLVHTGITDAALPDGARAAALRTVARLVESLVPETAVPFALAPDEVGAILPETDEPAAWELVGPILDAAGRASFTVREHNERRSLADSVDLHAALVSLGMLHPDGDRLVAAARRAVHADRPERRWEDDAAAETTPR